MTILFGFFYFQIRSLVQQKGELDHRVLVLEEELKKVETRLLAAVREKTGLTASVITLERQQAELKKINEFLKNKVLIYFLALKCLFRFIFTSLYTYMFSLRVPCQYRL